MLNLHGMRNKITRYSQKLAGTIRRGILQTIVLIISLLSIGQLAARAQHQVMGAVSCPAADTLSNVWLRHTYLNKRRPINGKLAIRATGNYKVYINETNVTPQITETVASTYDGQTTKTATIDVSRFLRSDSNTVAILYHPLSMNAADQPIAISYYGTLRNGKPFAYTADNAWLCRPTPRYGNDRIDRGYTQTIATACWTPATPQRQLPLALWTDTERRAEPAMLPYSIMTPRYSEHFSQGIEYQFGTAFYGYIRLTLRGAHRGDTITINGLSRICRGETDEQITTWPEPGYYRRIRITGNSRFKASYIKYIEGVCLKPTHIYHPLN